MKLNKIENTCSMFELGEAYHGNLKYITLKDFENFTKRELGRLHNPIKNFSIIYNCTNDTYYKSLKKLGFKQISRYKGWSNNDVKVLIWKSNNYTFLEKLEIFFKVR